MKTGRFAAIVLAAGLSSRMGAFKPLLPLGESTIVDRVITTFLKSNVDVYLVVGYHRDELVPAVKDKNVTVIENPDYERDMFTSVQVGVRGLRTDHKWFFVMPVDIPLVRPATVVRLMTEAEKHPNSVLYPTFNLRRGHPVLIPSRLIPQITQWIKDGGLKALLSVDDNRVDVEVPDSNVVFDIDTPEDFQQLRHRWQHYDVPSDMECDVILNSISSVTLDIREHCYKVAEVAVCIGRALVEAGWKPDLEVIRAAAVLHDLARSRPGHAAEGSRLLSSMGFDRIGEIVAVHMDLPDNDPALSLESKVVFLADKLVKGTTLVTIEQRYDAVSRAFGVNPDIEAAISGHKTRALLVRSELELCIGRPLERIIL
jgi:molybdenum cofactor cytidylyltransferase